MNLDVVNFRYVLCAHLVLLLDVALKRFVLGNASRATLNALLSELPSLMLLMYQHLNNDELMQAFHLHAPSMPHAKRPLSKAFGLQSTASLWSRVLARW